MTNEQSNTQTTASRIVAVLLGFPWVEILTEAWKYGQKVLRGMVSEGIYEVEEYEMHLELHDPKGKLATYHKKQRVKYLQNNVIAYHDQAWGDGETLLNYRCSPGKAVDRYRSGYKTLILISLQQVRHRGDRDDLNIEWEMKNSFTTSIEEWTTSVSHRTKRLILKTTFPAERPPIRVTLTEAHRQKHIPLGKEYLKKLPDGRWQVSKEFENPRLYEDYILRWEW